MLAAPSAEAGVTVGRVHRFKCSVDTWPDLLFSHSGRVSLGIRYQFYDLASRVDIPVSSQPQNSRTLAASNRPTGPRHLVFLMQRPYIMTAETYGSVWHQLV